MKKWIQGKTCVYCVTDSATTEDHVLSRRVFHTKGQPDMPLAPACKKCNRLKSDLELYVGAVLLFASKHPDAVKHLSTIGEHRLAKNLKLKKELYQGIGRRWRRDANGLFTPAVTMPVDSSKIENLAAMIGRGLLYHFWGVTLDVESTAIAIWLSRAGEGLFAQMLQTRAKARLSYALNSGMFSCDAAWAESDPRISVWRLSLFGGVDLTHDREKPGEDASQLGVMTGPISLLVPGRFEAALGKTADQINMRGSEATSPPTSAP